MRQFQVLISEDTPWSKHLNEKSQRFTAAPCVKYLHINTTAVSNVASLPWSSGRAASEE